MTVASAVRPFIACVLSTSLLAAGSHAPPARASGPSTVGQAASARPWVTLPKIAEHGYRIKAKVRLLLFWFGKDNVGSAVIRWYRGAGTDRGYEFLIGSDPARAPRQINRWGYIYEEHRGAVTTTVGVMKPADEASLEEAKANVEKAPGAGAVFTMLRETASQGESVAQLTKAYVRRDYSYRDLDALFGDFEKVTAAPEVRRSHFDADVTPGLLSTITAVMHEDAEARRHGRGPRGAQGRVARYVYNAKTYTLTLASSQSIGTQQYGGRSYSNLVEGDYDITMQGFTWKEKFTVVYAADDSGVEVPVFAVYQPRWWFKVELTLDDSQLF
jgi:hypothetical protein